MDRRDRASLASFHSPEPLAPGVIDAPALGAASAGAAPADGEQLREGAGDHSVERRTVAGHQSRVITLGEDAAHHARVRRLEVGERVRLVDGAGALATGTIVRVAKSSLAVEVGLVELAEPLPAVHVLVPIADRDRMLWLAEKCAELGATSWRPVMWRRSRSVSPKGEGSGFQRKVRARMIAALEQSGGAWLPAIFPDAKPEHAIAATPAGMRLLLQPEGEPILSVAARAGAPNTPVSIVLGPEGGLEEDEVAALVAAGFVPASLAGNVLRFETAAVAALAVVRAHLALTGERAHAE